MNVADVGTATDTAAPLDASLDTMPPADLRPNPTMLLPDFFVGATATETIEYSPSDWEFEQPQWDPQVGGPWTLPEFRSGSVGTRRAMAVSPATKHTPDPNTAALWLRPGDDLLIHFVVQSDPDEWQGGRIAVTPLLDWKPVPEAQYIQWDGDREIVKAEFSGPGAFIPMESQAEIFDLRIPAAAFVTQRHYELALAVRARGTENKIISKFQRMAVYAGGANRLSHRCVPPGSISDLNEFFPVDEYGNYLVGRHFGLIRPEGLPWEELPHRQALDPGAEARFDWFIRTHSRDRNAAFLPVVNGRPAGPVTFRQILSGRDGNDLAHHDSFIVTLPDADVADVYVAEWLDVHYPPRAPDGAPNYFPPTDQHGNAGERVFRGGSFGGTNAIRFENETQQ